MTRITMHVDDWITLPRERQIHSILDEWRRDPLGWIDGEVERDTDARIFIAHPTRRTTALRVTDLDRILRRLGARPRALRAAASVRRIAATIAAPLLARGVRLDPNFIALGATLFTATENPDDPLVSRLHRDRLNWRLVRCASAQDRWGDGVATAEEIVMVLAYWLTSRTHECTANQALVDYSRASSGRPRAEVEEVVRGVVNATLARLAARRERRLPPRYATCSPDYHA